MIELCKEAIILTEKERNLISELRKVEFGRVTIFIEHNIPLRIEEQIISKKL